MSWFFTSAGQNIGASASTSILSMNIQDWFPLELTVLASLQSKGLLRDFHLLKNFPQLVVIHTVKSFSVANEIQVEFSFF